jgi:hypothetical protein
MTPRVNGTNAKEDVRQHRIKTRNRDIVTENLELIPFLLSGQQNDSELTV